MNVLVIMSDTFRCDHLAAYGAPPPWTRPGHPHEPFISTPYLDRLAGESALFERFYLSSYPTVPCRSDLFTGQFGFPHRGWQPLEPSDVVLSEVVAAHGHTPMMIFDTPMLATDAYNYTRGFAGWDFVRGQHADRYVVDPISTVLPAAPHKLKNIEATHRYLRNSSCRRSEEDWMCAQTITRAMDWLERNQTRDDFVLWIDLWDPHEPFDAPEADLARYADPRFDGDVIFYPCYGRPDYMTDEERNHVRASYAALVTLTDRWIGRLLDKLAALGLDHNTMVIFLSDHGHLFGDHDLQGKPTGPLGKLYEPTTRVPLLIRHPEGIGAGCLISGIVQHPDLMATILDTLDISIPASVQGRSVWPLIRGDVDDLREFAVSGRFSRLVDTGRDTSLRRPHAAAFDGAAGIATPAEPLTLTTRRWSYLCPARRGDIRELYDLDADPSQTRNVLDVYPAVAAELHAKLIGFLEAMGTASERVDRYREPHASDAPTPLLPDDCPLSVIEDGRGVHLAYARPEEAAARLGPDLPTHAVGETTFGALRQASGRFLIDIHDQFYRPEDLS